MVKKLLALALAGVATPAMAQSFPKPPDVADYVPVTPLYKTDGTLNVVKDHTVDPMPIGSGLTNIPLPSLTGRIGTNGPHDGSASPFHLTIPFGGTAQENKFRTQVDFCYFAPDDPIRNYGQQGLAHLHAFYGGCSANAFTTYKTSRQHALSSRAAGTDANATNYWVPAMVVMNPYGNGKNYAIKPNGHIVYYTENPATDGSGDDAKAPIPVGLRYVFGFDMDSLTPSTQFPWLQSILDTANAAQGFTRYRLTNPTTGKFAGQQSFVCVGATPSVVLFLQNADGTDPYGGTCNDGQDFYVLVPAPTCYDGTNLWSPGGMKHLIPSVWDTVKNGWACPYNYYRISALIQEVKYTQHGWADRQRWAFSSDIAYRAARGLTAAQVPGGTTGHGDWMDGWDKNIRDLWELNCTGVSHTVGHECNTGQVSSTQYLIGSFVGEGGMSRVPQVDFTALPHVNETDPGWSLIPPAWSGSLTNMHVHQ